jgi:hypothetical protein
VADWSFSSTPDVDTRKQIVGLLMRHERKQVRFKVNHNDYPGKTAADALVSQDDIER